MFHFEIQIETGCPRKENRILGAAAALCLRDAMGGAAEILWPGEIVIDKKTAASVECRAAEGGALLSFDVDDAHAAEGLAELVENALRALAAGFPENSAEIIQNYCNHCRTLMKFVDVVYRGMPVYGFAFAVDRFGGLMVMTQVSRTVVTVYSGRAELAQDEPQQPDIPTMPGR